MNVTVSNELAKKLFDVLHAAPKAAAAIEALSAALTSERAAHEETQSRLAEALKALGPFARNVELIHPGAQDHDRLCDYGSQCNGTPTVGQARAARRVREGGKVDG